MIEILVGITVRGIIKKELKHNVFKTLNLQLFCILFNNLKNIILQIIPIILESNVYKTSHARESHRQYITYLYFWIGWVAHSIVNRSTFVPLCHKTVYVVLLSGANISKRLFTDGQDKYYSFQRDEFRLFYFLLYKISSALIYNVEY